MLDATTRAALIKAVQDAARAEVLPRFRALTAAQIDTKSSATDLVTEADKAMEDHLRRAFEVILPGVAFVGEESIAEEPGLIDALTRGEEAVILDKLEFGDGRARYEDAERDHHDNLIDLTTGEVIEFVDPEIEALQARLAEKLGYALKGHRLELYGVPRKKS